MAKLEGITPWKYTIWGSRGSAPTSTPELRAYGGQTTCHEIDLPHARILIDAGSGLVELARACGDEQKETLLLFTHLHWDHVVGFPFFSPLFSPGWDLHIRGVPRGGAKVFDTLCTLNQPPLFPINLRESIRAHVLPVDLEKSGRMNFQGVGIEWMEVWHPGGCSAFAFTIGRQRIVFTGDVEIPRGDYEALVDFCRGADVLICDAQYGPEQYLGHIGWGHSTNLHAAGLARDAEVKRLILTHHDPVHDDETVDGLVEQARDVFPATEGARHRMVVAGSGGAGRT